MTFPFNLPAWLLLALRMIVAGIFIYAGVSKAVAPVRFITDVNNFHLLPWTLSVATAFYLPWLEIGCGVALLLKRLDRGAALVLLLLTSMFVIALASARVRGIDVSCGCFGHAAHDLTLASHLILNFGIIAILILILLRIARPGPA